MVVSSLILLIMLISNQSLRTYIYTHTNKHTASMHGIIVTSVSALIENWYNDGISIRMIVINYHVELYKW